MEKRDRKRDEERNRVNNVLYSNKKEAIMMRDEHNKTFIGGLNEPK